MQGGPLRQILASEKPTAEELAQAERDKARQTRRTQQTVTTPLPAPCNAVAAPVVPKGCKGLVEYVKCKIEYWIEYRKQPDGSWVLHHADAHLMEQLKDLPVGQYRAAMERMFYTYVERQVI